MEVTLRVAALTVFVCSVLVLISIVRTARARREWEQKHRDTR